MLLRAAEVVDGLDLARERRPRSSDRDLARGPARMCRAMAIGQDQIVAIRADGFELTDFAGAPVEGEEYDIAWDASARRSAAAAPQGRPVAGGRPGARGFGRFRCLPSCGSMHCRSEIYDGRRPDPDGTACLPSP